MRYFSFKLGSRRGYLQASTKTKAKSLAKRHCKRGAKIRGVIWETGVKKPKRTSFKCGR